MRTWLTSLLVAVLSTAALAADAIPPAAARKVDFTRDVAPIFETSCMQCHANGKYESDLSIESRAKLLEGGASDAAIVLGKSHASLLIELVSGTDPDRIMPKKGKRLTPEQIGILRAWIDQGADWPKGFVLHDLNKPIPAKLEPRNVPIPPAIHEAGGDLTNPIDRLLQPYFESHKVTPKKVVDDRVYARRVYLDIIGMLPTPTELDAFLNDNRADKRQQLVTKLLTDDDRYAEHWMSFWNDMLRNDYKGTGYIDGGRLQITRWLYESLKKDMPYDEFVRQLVTAAPGAEGFTKGIVWRGVVNAAQTPQMQAAQNIGQVFMGVNLKCASCHDSFVSQWKLTDSFGLAGVFADKPLDMERCAKSLGKTAPMKFLYPELGTIDANAPKEVRVQQLANAVTSERNGRLSRTIVNRLWRRLMGRGIVEPVDEMDNIPWNADLLDALAWDFAHGQKYDVKKMIEEIVLSRAYQLPAVPVADENNKDYVFAGPGIKRMTAEEFVDAVSEISGVWSGTIAAKLTDNAERYAKAKWIWNNKDAATSAPPGKVYFRKVIDVKRNLSSFKAILTADNAFQLYVNGKEVARGEEWTKPVSVELQSNLVIGKNVIAVIAENTTATPSPAGFWMHGDGKYTTSQGPNRDKWVLNSDKSWACSPEPADGWLLTSFDDAKWQKATDLGGVTNDPWKLVTMLPDESPLEHPDEIRSALCAADPLTIALGRPNRDQVNTERPTAATTLMALEMTNGATLNDELAKAAKKMATDKDVNVDALINSIFIKALGRAPVPAEMTAAKEIVGANAPQEGVEDFLWAVVMLPEFQLIR